MKSQAQAQSIGATFEYVSTQIDARVLCAGRYFGPAFGVASVPAFVLIGSAGSCVEAARCELVLLDVDAGQVLRGSATGPLRARRCDATGAFWLVCGDTAKLGAGRVLRAGLYVNSGGPVTAGVVLVNMAGFAAASGGVE